jgi:HAD superfamily hydrolase (TIGR01484 family)
MQIAAILCDYDGTLCPTSSVKTEESAIPEGLNNILWDISEKIPVCIVSSKDFGFLHKRTTFANIISCILGIETLLLKRHKKDAMITTKGNNSIVTTTRTTKSIADCNKLNCITDHHILVADDILQHNSRLLDCLADEVLSNFKDVIVERKYVSNKATLAGITIDWRHLRDWKSFKKTSEPLLEKAIRKQQELSFNTNTLYTQTYTTHPFIDVYAVKCNKSIAFDRVISEIPFAECKGHKIMYLGDSENDNPAFRRADVSIGVLSDDRLNPKLKCEYTISFNQLSIFLNELLDKDFEFSDYLLPDHQMMTFRS